MLDKLFRLRENNTNVRTELLAGTTTFLTMSYIIFVQPAVLSGSMFGMETGMDFGSVMTATCLAAALATAIMGIWARYPIAQAPGMGENFFFVFSVLPAAALLIKEGVAAGTLTEGATTPWQIALGVVFIAGILFVVLSVLGVREKLLDAVSPSMRNGIAVGIGLFIAFIGMKNATLILADASTGVKLNVHFASPDIVLFLIGLFVTAGLSARHVRGAIVISIVFVTLLAMAFKFTLPYLPEAIAESATVTDSLLMTRFEPTAQIAALPPSMEPTFFKMDVVNACSKAMIPFIIIFLFMDLFDTLGTLIGVSEQAELIKDNKLPRAGRAMLSDAVGTAAGAAMGTSTVTSFIESAAGVEQGGRTGLTAVTAAVLFLLALFFSPLVAMVGSYPVVTAPALVVVGSMMLRNVTKIDWSNPAESIPSFLILLGIPLSYSIADGLAIGFIAYPVVKLIAGQWKDIKPLMVVMAVVMVAYFVFVKGA